MWLSIATLQRVNDRWATWEHLRFLGFTSASRVPWLDGYGATAREMLRLRSTWGIGF